MKQSNHLNVVGVTIALSLLSPFPASATTNKPISRPGTEAQAVKQISDIRGTVVDETGEPIVGASVVVSGTKNATVTDIEGHFTISAPSKATLQVSYIGMHSVHIAARDGLRITLKADVNDMEEVVVVGYGTMRKKDLTGSISTVQAERLEKEAPRSIQDILKGAATGLYVSMSTNAAGTSDMQIRGKNTLTAGSSPLYVVDGVIYQGSLQDLNPMDIESVDVLKDASSVAVYGAKAASGVIAITTKKGSTGKPRINFNANIGTAHTARLPKMVDGAGFIKFRQEYNEGLLTDKEKAEKQGMYQDPRTLQGVDLLTWYNYDKKEPATELPDENGLVSAWLQRLEFSDIEIQHYLEGRETNWDDEIFHTGLQQDYTVSISNRTDRHSYYTSLGYADRKGVTRGDRYTNLRARVNMDTKVTSYLRIGLNSQFSYRKGGYLAADASQRENLSPYTSNEIGNPTSIYREYPSGENVSVNPFFNNLFIRRKQNDFELNGKLYGILSLPFGFEYEMDFTPRLHWYEYFNHNSSENPEWAGTGGESTRSHTRYLDWQIDNIIRWKKTFGLHRLELTLLQNAEKNQSWSTSAGNKLYSPSDILGFHRLQSGTDPTVSSDDTYDTGDALMARLFYQYDRKYMLTASVRRDGYSAFGQENPHATFPAFALGWVFSEEKFMKSTASWLNYGKLRLSWGANGNRDIGRYAALAQLTTGMYTYLDGSGNPYIISQIYISVLGNSKLKWERTAAWNWGLDFSLFNDRISGSIDYYRSKTTNLLVDRSLPSIIGYSSIKANLGELQNHGLEISLTAHPYISKNFRWDTSGSCSFNRRKIVHLYGDKTDVRDADGNVIGQKEADDYANSWFIGHDPNQIWNYKRDGVWQVGEEEEAAKYGCKPGDFKYVDQNGDGVLNTDDKVFQGYTTPRYYASWRNDFTFLRDFTLSFMMYGHFGQYGTFNRAANTGGMYDRHTISDIPRWTAEHPTSNYARIGSTNLGSNYVRKTFVRMENITLGYRLPETAAKYIGITGASFSLSVRNPFVITGWSYGDPEGGDYTMRTVNLGINLTL